MNRAPFALCGLLCTLGSTLIAAGMAHDGYPCSFSPRPQPKIGVQATTTSRCSLANFDSIDRWLAPDLWQQVKLVPLERRHEKVVPTPVKKAETAVKSAPIRPDIRKIDFLRATSRPVGFAAGSSQSAKTDNSLPRLVRAAEMASQTEAILRWISAQDGINYQPNGVYISGSIQPLDQKVFSAFGKAIPGSLSPWTVAVHAGVGTQHLFDSNFGYDGYGLRVSRSLAPTKAKYGPDSLREIARTYRVATQIANAGITVVADQFAAIHQPIIDLGLSGGYHLHRTTEAILARVKAPVWNLIPGGNKPTEIGGKPAKVRSAELPRKTTK